MNNFLKKMANPTRLSLATLYDVVIAAAAAFLCYVAVTNAMGLLAGMMTDQKNYYERHTKLGRGISGFRHGKLCGDRRRGDHR